MSKNINKFSRERLYYILNSLNLYYDELPGNSLCIKLMFIDKLDCSIKLEEKNLVRNYLLRNKPSLFNHRKFYKHKDFYKSYKENWWPVESEQRRKFLKHILYISKIEFINETIERVIKLEIKDGICNTVALLDFYNWSFSYHCFKDYLFSERPGLFKNNKFLFRYKCFIFKILDHSYFWIPKEEKIRKDFLLHLWNKNEKILKQFNKV